MDADLDTLATALYVRIDDALKDDPTLAPGRPKGSFRPKLSDAELKDQITQLQKEEDEISYRRRILHGKIDILRAELVARLQAKPESELAEVDLDALTRILSGKTGPEGD